MNKRIVPKKNYYILTLLLIGVIVITFAVVNIVNSVKNNNVNSGYINKYVSVLSYDELDTYLVEPSSNTFIYITYTGDENVYKLEKNLKKIVNNYELADNFIYVDVTKKLENKNFYNDLNKKIASGENIKQLPVILYYKDGILTDKLLGKNNTIFSVADFQKLLDNYEITN